MCRSISPSSPHRRPYYHRTIHFLIEHVMEFGSMVDDLVECQGHEIPEHDLGKRLESIQRKPVGDTCQRRLGDRCRKNAVRPEERQILGYLESAAIRRKHILSQEYH